jgi:hypothetical protein
MLRLCECILCVQLIVLMTMIVTAPARWIDYLKVRSFTADPKGTNQGFGMGFPSCST